jgi:hypothetical protein
MKSSTTAMKDHIVKFHYLNEETDPNAALAGKPTNLSNEDICQYIKTEDDNPTFEQALLDWITYTNKPFTVAENEWFIRMIRALGCRDWIPKADVIRNKLEARIDGVYA